VTQRYQAETKIPNFMKFGTYKYKPHEIGEGKILINAAKNFKTFQTNPAASAE